MWLTGAVVDSIVLNQAQLFLHDGPDFVVGPLCSCHRNGAVDHWNEWEGCSCWHEHDFGPRHCFKDYWFSAFKIWKTDLCMQIHTLKATSHAYFQLSKIRTVFPLQLADRLIGSCPTSNCSPLAKAREHDISATSGLIATRVPVNIHCSWREFLTVLMTSLNHSACAFLNPIFPIVQNTFLFRLPIIWLLEKKVCYCRVGGSIPKSNRMYRAGESEMHGLLLF